AMLLTSTGAVGDGGRDVVRADRGCGRSLPRCCSCRLERWEITPGTLPTSSGALPGTCWPLPGRIWTLLDAGAGVGDGTRHVADVVRHVAGLPGAVAGRIRDVSRVVYAVSAPVLHAFFLPLTSGVPDVQRFSRVRGRSLPPAADCFGARRACGLIA